MTFISNKKYTYKILCLSLDGGASNEAKIDDQEFEMQPEFCQQPQMDLPDIRVELCSKDLWRKFHTLGTEMIITKAGR